MPGRVGINSSFPPGVHKLTSSSWQRGCPVHPWRISLLESRSTKWVFFNRGPLERTDSTISSILGCLEEPKEGGSLIWMAISSLRPSLLATWRVAAANELNGLRPASGSPLMGNMVKYLPLLGWGEYVSFMGVDTKTTQSSLECLK